MNRDLKICLLPIVGFLLVASYANGFSTYGAPAEFGNETTTTCYVGGDPGILNCTGDLTSTNCFCDGANITNIGLNADTDVTRIATVGGTVNLSKGQPVYIMDATGDKPRVSLGNNQYHNSSHIFGVAAESKSIGEDIFIRLLGDVIGTGSDPLDTTNFTEGCRLHLDSNFSCNIQPNGSHIHGGTASKINAITGIQEVKISDYIHDVQGTLDLNVSVGGFGIDFMDYNRDVVGWMDTGSKIFTWEGNTTARYATIGLGEESENPAIIFDGVTKDGYVTWSDEDDYFDFDDDVLISANEKLYFRDTNSYIIASSPGSLDFFSSNGIQFNRITPNQDVTLNFIATNNSGSFTWMEDEDYFKFDDIINATKNVFVGENVTIDGLVGIGTNNASYKLDLRSASSASQLHFASSDVDSGGYVTTAGAGNFFFSGGTAWNGSNWIAKHTQAGIIGVQNTGDIQIFADTGLTAGNTFTPTSRMIIDSATGRVGIGEASPFTRLHAKIADAGANPGFLPANDFVFEGDKLTYLSIFTPNTKGGGFICSDPERRAEAGVECSHVSPFLLDFRAGGDIRATVDGATGFFGIGTRSSTHTLNVVGSSNITEDLIVEGNFTGNQIHGSMYFHNDSVGNLTALDEDVWNNLTAFDQAENGQILNGVDYSSSVLTVVIPGTYLMGFSMTFTGTVNNKYHGTIGLNGDPQFNFEDHDRISTGSDVLDIGSENLFQVVAGDQLTVMIMNEDSGGDATILSARLYLIRQGD